MLTARPVDTSTNDFATSDGSAVCKGTITSHETVAVHVDHWIYTSDFYPSKREAGERLAVDLFVYDNEGPTEVRAREATVTDKVTLRFGDASSRDEATVYISQAQAQALLAQLQGLLG